MRLAHGVGGRQDLPIPFELALGGALLALAASFLALGLLWREPRISADPDEGRPFPDAVQRVVGAPAWGWVWRFVGLAVAGYALSGFVEPDTVDNPTPGVVYVLFWVGLLPLSLLFGPVWRGLNPLRTLHLLACVALRRDPERGFRALPAGLGCRPAAVGLLAFVWLELVAPDRVTLPVIGTWLAGYAVAMLAGATVYGAGWFERGDAFEVYNAVVGRLAPVGRREDGTVVRRHPLDGMAGLPPAPGLVAFAVVLLGSTMYDSVSNAPFWVRFVQEGSPTPLGGAGLLLAIGLVLVAYLAATWLADRLGDGRGTAPAELAHTLVPIAVGYLVAHYFTLFVLEGQRTIVLLPGTGDWTVRTLGTSPDGTALLQVSVIVLGHVVGTVLSHDRALQLFGRRATVAQIPLLVLMLGFTTAGLWLLFAA